MTIDLESLDKATRNLLEQYGFDAVPFDDIVDQLLATGLDVDKNRLTGTIALPGEATFTGLAEADSAKGDRLARIGQAAIDSGQVGAVVLNGGMATRFGGGAKGVTTAVAGRSFLDLKIGQVAAAGGGVVPVLLMNSFATDRATADHLRQLDPGCEVTCFSQMISLRLTRSGGLLVDARGKPSLHAPGHGDLPFALARSGALDRFLKGGGRYLTVSNVDNLGAGLDPRVVGAHIDGGNPMTVEIVETYPGDVGGFPALVDGRLMIVEAFRLPVGFDETTIPVFNTNTFVFDAEALAGDYDLDWFAAVKQVDGREAVQFERLVGQLTEFLDVTWLKVPRAGPASRFIPIKVPADLEQQRSHLETMLTAQGVL